MPRNFFFKYILFISLPTLLLACREEVSYVERTVVASIGDEKLYKDEADIEFAKLGHRADSAAFMRDYIEQWAVEMLFYAKAKENVASTDEIEAMVDNYRRSLILNLYQDRLITQQLVPDISDEEVCAFYNDTKLLFELDEPYIKGFYVKLPNKAKQMRDVRKWCMDRGQEELDELERLCSENEYEYNFLMEEWVPFADFAHRLPLTEQDLMSRLERKEMVEFKDAGFTYFVATDSMLKKGDTKPIEMVSGEIRELLLNSKKANFIKNVKQSLYDEAVKNGMLMLH